MLESDMRQIVIKALVGLDAVSVENPAYPGTPDVNFIEGWVELKILQKWPARESTKVAVPKFTNQQRVWLQRRCRRGGRAFLLLKVGSDWLLFDGATASKKLGKMTRLEMLDSCLLYNSPSLRTKELITVLRTWQFSGLRI